MALISSVLTSYYYGDFWPIFLQFHIVKNYQNTCKKPQIVWKINFDTNWVSFILETVHMVQWHTGQILRPGFLRGNENDV